MLILIVFRAHARVQFFCFDLYRLFFLSCRNVTHIHMYYMLYVAERNYFIGNEITSTPSPNFEWAVERIEMFINV